MEAKDRRKVFWRENVTIRFPYLNALKASNRNDDHAGIRWINSDLIGFTSKMKNIKYKIIS